MTVGCQWIENNLEALSNASLNEEESRLAHTHMESCDSCRNEVQALKAIDPLVKTFFQRELANDCLSVIGINARYDAWPIGGERGHFARRLRIIELIGGDYPRQAASCQCQKQNGWKPKSSQ